MCHLGIRGQVKVIIDESKSQINYHLIKILS